MRPVGPVGPVGMVGTGATRVDRLRPGLAGCSTFPHMTPMQHRPPQSPHSAEKLRTLHKGIKGSETPKASSEAKQQSSRKGCHLRPAHWRRGVGGCLASPLARPLRFACLSALGVLVFPAPGMGVGDRGLGQRDMLTACSSEPVQANSLGMSQDLAGEHGSLQPDYEMVRASRRVEPLPGSRPPRFSLTSH